MYSMLFHSLFPKERFFKHMVSGTRLLRKNTHKYQYKYSNQPI